MTKFLGDIAIVLEMLVIATGLVMVHFSQKEKSPLIKSASYLLLIGGLIMGFCTSFYHLKYFFRGEYYSATTSISRPLHRMKHTDDRRGGHTLFKKFHKYRSMKGKQGIIQKGSSKSEIRDKNTEVRKNEP